MNTKITMNGVASYIAPTVLETDKKVTLVYGLNGTGKSTLSNYLSDPTHSMYAGCVTAGLEEAHIYVYNNRFVKDNFHEMDKLKGIFTLSKFNKQAEEQLEAAKQDLKGQTSTKMSLDKSIADLTNGMTTAKTQAEEITWKIKTQFTGGDRVLEFCLDGLKGTKGRLFDHIAALPMPAAKPIKTTNDLRSESEALAGEKAQNFAYWNGAPADQQVTPHMRGDETVTLANLCPTDARTDLDAMGNTLLSFALPGHLPFVLARFMDGRIGELPAKLDTLIIDAAPHASNPEKKPSVVCVWRATVATDPNVRVLEARMLSQADVVALREQAENAQPRSSPVRTTLSEPTT